MPITFEIDRKRKTVFARAFGVLAEQEMFDYQKELQAAPELRHFHECVDMTGVTDVQGSTDRNMTALAELAAKMDDPEHATRLAIVADSDICYGLARMYQTYRSMQKTAAREVTVFRTREEALRWLDTEPQA